MAARTHLVVDGMNVIGSRPDGWWRDRDGAVRRLVAALAALRGAEGQERITVVFDGRPLADLPEGDHGGVEVLYAHRRSRDGADDRIVAEISEAGTAASRIAVATSDRALQQRVRRAGAAVARPSVLLVQLEVAASTPSPEESSS